MVDSSGMKRKLVGHTRHLDSIGMIALHVDSRGVTGSMSPHIMLV